MSVNFSSEAGECRLNAEHCADRARFQSDPQLHQDFLEMQRRWLALARSYEFAERLEFLSAVEISNKETRLIIEDAAAAGPPRASCNSAPPELSLRFTSLAIDQAKT
jgi:hypothetical protein